MKAYHSILAILLIFFFSICINSQDVPAYTYCGTPDSTIVFNGPIGTTTMNVVFVFLDFPDGRLSNGQIPSTDNELNQVSNLDAVLNMGFIPNEGGDGYDQKVRKYTYADFWNMYFSTNTFTGTAHPDWNSHGAYGFPPDGDTARAFGSFKEYMSEVSYGKLTINAPVTHVNETGIYRTGIVNNIITQGDIKYIEPIVLSNNKSSYGIPGIFESESSGFSSIKNDANNKLISMFNNSEIEFNISSHLSSGGRVIYIFAGGSFHIGGVQYGNELVIREKRAVNKNYQYPQYDDPTYNIINGLTVYCHEFGHSLGFGHNGTGNYCAMTMGTSNQNCPSHFSIANKLKAGWIDPQYVRFINSNESISDLPPSIHNGDCAVVTIYGKAGYSELVNSPNYNHSEYYIIENRRMLRDNPDYKFDKKFVWQRDNMPNPQLVGFNGGCLITHYTPYNELQIGYSLDISSSIKIMKADPNPQLPLTPETEGHSNHFFGVEVLGEQTFSFLTDNDAGTDRTKSSFDLKTGIRLTNIIDPGDGNIDFTLNYSLGEPPDYDKVLYGQQLSDPFIMDGFYFVSAIGSSSVAEMGGNIEISEGTTIESINQGLEYTTTSSNANFEANGTSENPITFQGAGYQNYRLNFYGMNFININNINTSPIKLEYCNFVSDIPNRVISFRNVNSDKSIILNNINSSGRGDLSFSINNSTSQIDINNVNFSSGPRKLTLGSTNDIQNQAILSSLSGSQFEEYNLSGTWLFDIQNDFTVDEGKVMNISSQTGSKSEIIYSGNFKTIIEGDINISGSFMTNRDLHINSAGSCIFRAWDRENSPSIDNLITFPAGYGLICDGQFDASAVKDSLIFSVEGNGNWNGISCQNNGSFLMNNVKVRNAETGIYINNPLGTVDIQNSRFSDNQVHDVFLENLPQISELPRLIKNNIFTGNSNKISGLTCNNGVNILIESNIFDDDYSNGISLLYMTDPNLVSNIFAATLTSGYTPFGIYAYSSGGFYSCNNITNYSSGIKLDNSSPFIYNNDIFNNGNGVFLQNNSNPILTPAYSPGGTLYTGGYNRIFNNLNEEIFCDNTSIFVPTSIPIMDYGYNSIYDENSDCLLDVGIVGYFPTMTYYIRDNYWGGGDPQTRICGDNVNFEYDPYLEGEPEPPASCFPFMEMSNNSSMSQSTLLLGSAIIDEYNGNISSSVDKYKDLIDPAGNKHYSFLALSKILYSVSKGLNPDFYALENYYSAISGQYSTDTLFSRKSSSFSTAADVEQPSYPEAISEYQAVINNPLNEYERHYAYIDQLRTFRLMLDSLLSGFDNGPNGFNMNENDFKLVIEKGLNLKFDKDISSSKQRKVKNESKGKGRSGELISNISESDRKMQIDGLKRSLRLENVATSNLSNSEKISLLNRVISFKLFEYSVLNDPNNSRPLNRVIVSKKTSSISETLPVKFKLHQNYPNPFNPVSTIKFDIPKETKVVIKIYDLLGREVLTLVNELKQPGFYETVFNGKNLASGLYIYRIEAGQFVDVKKMVLVK